MKRRKPRKTIKSKARVQKAVATEGIPDYVASIEARLEETEKKVSGALKKEDVTGLWQTNEAMKDLENRVNKLENTPIIPPLSSLPKKTMGALTKRISMLEDAVQEMQGHIRKEKSETMSKYTRFAEINSNMAVQIDKINEAMESAKNKMDQRINAIEEGFEALKSELNKAKETMALINNIRVKDVPLEIESLKERGKWLENAINEIDMESLAERIEEMEHQINLLRASSPYVVE